MQAMRQPITIWVDGVQAGATVLIASTKADIPPRVLKRNTYLIGIVRKMLRGKFYYRGRRRFKLEFDKGNSRLGITLSRPKHPILIRVRKADMTPCEAVIDHFAPSIRVHFGDRQVWQQFFE